MFLTTAASSVPLGDVTPVPFLHRITESVSPPCLIHSVLCCRSRIITWFGIGHVTIVTIVTWFGTGHVTIVTIVTILTIVTWFVCCCSLNFLFLIMMFDNYFLFLIMMFDNYFLFLIMMFDNYFLFLIMMFNN